MKPHHSKPLEQLQALAKARLWTHGIKRHAAFLFHEQGGQIHSQTNFWVIRDINRRAGLTTEALQKLPMTDINRVARELLREDSQLRQRKVRKSS